MGRTKGSKNAVNKIQEQVEAVAIADKPLFSVQHQNLAKQIKGLFQFPPESNENFEIKLMWFMKKDNLYYELFTYYWMTVFYREYNYMNLDYIKKELNIK